MFIIYLVFFISNPFKLNNLPGILDVFPELRLPWTKWIVDKNGNRKECIVDSDCPFPYACCHHPILPGTKYCCSGWNKRKLIPKYIGSLIKSE
jgi:hypothetical protein